MRKNKCLITCIFISMLFGCANQVTSVNDTKTKSPVENNSNQTHEMKDTTAPTITLYKNEIYLGTSFGWGGDPSTEEEVELYNYLSSLSTAEFAMKNLLEKMEFFTITDDNYATSDFVYYDNLPEPNEDGTYNKPWYSSDLTEIDSYDNEMCEGQSGLLKEGTYTAYIIASDTEGNITKQAFTVICKDN